MTMKKLTILSIALLFSLGAFAQEFNDYLEVSRATGIFLFLLSGDERTDLTTRFFHHMAINAPDEIMK